MPNSRIPPRRRKRGLSRSQSLGLIAIALVLGGILAALALVAVTQPDAILRLVSLRPAPTLYVLNPSNTPDPRGTLPGTWTPTRRPPPLPTATASCTPTPTATPPPSVTPVPTLTLTPPATPPPGWFEVEVKAALFAIQVTSTWLPVPLTDRDASTALAEIAQRDPVQASSLRDGLGQAVLDYLILVAFDTATVNDLYVNNLSVAYANPAEGDSVDAIRDRHLEIYEENEFYEVLASDSTRIDGRPAQRIRYTTQYAVEDGTITVYHLEVITEGRRSEDPILIFTFSTSEGRRNIYEALFDRMASTIRFTRKPVPTATPLQTPTVDFTRFPPTPTPDVTATPSPTTTPTQTTTASPEATQTLTVTPTP